MFRSVAAVLTMVLLGSPAIACINDYELSEHEREFRSNYNQPVPPPPSPAPASEPGPPVLVASGVLMLVAAAFVGLRGRARG